nr:3-oxoacyl-ACP reductase FabG [Desulfobulbaceae bacterium]
MQINMDFSGQIAVVTGATKGIGLAVTQALLEAGATVVGVYGSDTVAAGMVAKDLDVGDRLQLFQCDVSDYAQVTQLYQKIEDQYESIDILISNAGIRRDSVLAMMPYEDWQRVIDVNLTGSYSMAKHAVMLMMKKKYGRIIFVTSPMSYLGFAGQANYSASKAGQIGMMRSLSKETAKRKITVNCISPGFIETDLIANLNDEQIKQYQKMVPLKRFGRPREVADAVLFLAGKNSAYITGSVLEINGGI